MTDLQSLIDHTKLAALDVVHCTWTRSHPLVTGALAYPPRLTQHLNFVVHHSDPMPHGAVTFLCVMQLRWTPPQEETLLASAEVHIRAAYEFNDQSLALNEQDARAFGLKVALHQAWPFLRHRHQQLCMELNLNPGLLPLKPLIVDAAAAHLAEPAEG